jgi:hypothetical protein
MIRLLSIPIFILFAMLAFSIFVVSCSPSPEPSTSNGGGSGGSSQVGDTTRPAVVILSPTNGESVYDSTITVSGTASDEGSGVKEVRLSLDNGEFNLVNGTTSWSTNLSISLGSHTISVYAVDNSNNVSVTNSITIVRPIVIYVAADGNDTNDGLTPSTRVYSMVRAMEVARSISYETNVEIRVTEATYIPQYGLSNSSVGFIIDRPNVTIIGGWYNSAFTNISSKTTFRGYDGSSIYLYHVIKIENATNIVLKSLIIKDGRATGTHQTTEVVGYLSIM